MFWKNLVKIRRKNKYFTKWNVFVIAGKKVLAVITARAGSAGLKGKNYRILAGRPLVEWSILAALKSKYVDEILVSTNCKHVKRATGTFIEKEEKHYLSRLDHLHVVDRPDELATPTSKNEEALIHAVQYYEEKHSDSIDWVVNLQPTSPVRNDNLIDRCLEAMDDANADSLLTVNRHTPFFWKIAEDKPKPMYDVLNRPMRQEVKDWFFFDNGNTYLMTTEVLMSRMCRIGENPYLFETSEEQSYQIDTELDFAVLEAVSAYLNGELA
jgi:N-acylneuraminate cytidylyltransferase